MVNNNKNIPELLVPAGNLKILEYAVAYGADAVYIGGKEFNLRSLGDNFSRDELEKAVSYCHKKNVKTYITLNSIIFENEIKKLIEYLNTISNVQFDGFIISDPAVLKLLNNFYKKPNIHISTQVNVTNSMSVNLYKELGAKRINIAREIKFNDLKEIIKKTDIEIEIFVHGALCISYSGRCMLSKYMAGRDANRGECAHSCRWKYYLMEEERPNLFFNIIQDNKGTFIYNSRDLCLLDKLDLLADAGVSAFKIEGRMKTESYIAQTVWAYRKALDYIKNDEFDKDKKAFLMNELNKCSHRNYTSGFMFLNNYKELEDNEGVGYIKNYRFVGLYNGKSEKYGLPLVLVKNQFKTGENIEILEPQKLPKEVRIREIRVIKNNTDFTSGTANPNDTVVLRDVGDINPYAILRIKE
ncbi:MAG: U32 family peptidase [Cyanobacteria bacterium]|nr:U32 family peptidase [Cyanobacteriota bacterium]